jgi:hypothetical protein
MQTNRVVAKNRPLPAILAALGITLVVGMIVVILGANALLSTGVPFLQAPAEAQAAAAPVSDSASSDQIQQVTAQFQAREQQFQAHEQQYADLVKQYQAREKQYNQQLQQATQERNAAQAQAQQYQQVLDALQQAGIIQIGPDGQIFLARPSRGGFNDHD